MDKLGVTEHPAPTTGATGLAPSHPPVGFQSRGKTGLRVWKGGKEERVWVPVLGRSSPPRGAEQGGLGAGQAWD